MAKHDEFIQTLKNQELLLDGGATPFIQTRMNQALQAFRLQKDYPVFCFGKIPGDVFFTQKELIKTAHEFYKSGLLPFPFEHFIYSYYLDEGDGLVVPYFIFVTPIKDNKDGRLQRLCVECSMRPASEDKDLLVRMSEYSIVIDYLDRSININRMCTETDFSSNTDAIKLDTAQFYNFLFYFTMLLNTKSVKCEEVEIPDKLQKARERKGKPKLSNYILVSNPTVVRNSSGTHASPRPHWRRGHVRHWGEKRIPIPPVIVNAAKRTGLVEHRTYIVDRNDPDAARI